MESFSILKSVDTTTKFGEKLKNYFRPYMTCPESFNWEALLKFVKSNEQNLLDEIKDNDKKVFLKFFRDVLNYYDCPSLRLVNKLMDVYVALQSYDCDEQSYNYDIFAVKRGNTVRLIENILNDTDNFDSNREFFRRISKINSLRCIPTMKILVKNGLCSLPPENIFFNFQQGNRGKEWLFRAIYNKYVGEHRNPEDERASLQILHANICNALQSPTRRTTLLLVTLKFFKYIKKSHRVYYKEYLRLLHNTIPDPYVSHQEIEEFLAWKVYYGLNTGTLVQLLIRDMENELPEWSRSCEPRSLHHLCRVKVREAALGKGETVPQAVAKLNIPKKLKQFIFAHDEQFVMTGTQ